MLDGGGWMQLPTRAFHCSPRPRHTIPGPRVWLLAHRGGQPQHASNRGGRRSHHLGALPLSAVPGCAFSAGASWCWVVSALATAALSANPYVLQLPADPPHPAACCLCTWHRAGTHAAHWGTATASRRASRSVLRAWRRCRSGRRPLAAGTCWRWMPRGSAGRGVSPLGR